MSSITFTFTLSCTLIGWSWLELSPTHRAWIGVCDAAATGSLFIRIFEEFATRRPLIEGWSRRELGFRRVNDERSVTCVAYKCSHLAMRRKVDWVSPHHHPHAFPPLVREVFALLTVEAKHCSAGTHMLGCKGFWKLISSLLFTSSEILIGTN